MKHRTAYYILLALSTTLDYQRRTWIEANCPIHVGQRAIPSALTRLVKSGDVMKRSLFGGKDIAYRLSLVGIVTLDQYEKDKNREKLATILTPAEEEAHTRACKSIVACGGCKDNRDVLCADASTKNRSVRAVPGQPGKCYGAVLFWNDYKPWHCYEQVECAKHWLALPEHGNKEVSHV